MGKDKVVIAVVATIVFSAILFGIFMAYKIYYSPMSVYSIEDKIEKRQELEYACYDLKIITSEELNDIWNQ